MLDRILMGSSAEASDPNFKNVTLLLHGDGSNGAQNNTFLDSSTNNFTITRNGNTTQGSFSPYGSNWSNYFDGSGDYLSAPSNAAFDCGTGDWTIECWVYISTRTNSYPVIFGNNRGSWTTDALALTNSNADSGGIYADRFVFGWNNGGFSSVSYGTSQLLVANATNSNNTWYHFAVVRNGTSIKMYRNGVEVASATISSGASFNWGYNGALVGGGNWDGAGSYFNGYISNLRVLKGTALYTSTFTPSTTPLTAITNTSLLTCAYNRFRDGSTNNFTITRNGDVKVTNFSPFAPSAAYSTTTNGGSAVFDGTSDYCRIASSQTALQFGTGDFTIDGWVFSTNGTGTYQQMLTGGTSWTSGSGGVYWYYNSGSPYIGAAWNQVATNPAVNSGTLEPYAWHHFAFVRNGNTLTLYVNGTSVDTIDVTGVSLAVNNQSQTNIGGGGWDNDFAGYMSNVRVVKGTAVYTANFTPPTSPTTAITNTGLLLNATNAAIFDNSMKNDLETVGNAQISTSVKKFGTGSMYFDGSGDYLIRYQSLDLRMGAGNFTAECWIYPTSKTGWRGIFYKGNNSNQAEYSLGWEDGVLTARLADNGSFEVTDTTTLNAWNHVAYVRNGTTFTVYINGVSQGTATSSTSFVSTQNNEPFIIGYYDFVGNLAYYQGYIDDLRITKGLARYTANFTAPTAPFPNK